MNLHLQCSHGHEGAKQQSNKPISPSCGLHSEDEYEPNKKQEGLIKTTRISRKSFRTAVQLKKRKGRTSELLFYPKNIHLLPYYHLHTKTALQKCQLTRVPPTETDF